MSSSKANPHIHVHVALNWVNHSSRMLKETESIINAGLADEIYLAGKWEPSIPELENLSDGRRIVRVKPWSGRFPKHPFFGLFVQIETTIRLVLLCNTLKPTVIQCHWLEALPVGFLYRHFFNKKVKIIYDAHELETEKFGVHNTFKKPIYKRLERAIIRDVDLVIVVSSSIASWYRKEYSLKNLVTIRNIPSRKPPKAQNRAIGFRGTYNIRDDEILFIYQGRLSPARGLEAILEVFSSLPPEYHVVFMGYGAFEPTVQRYAQEYANIHFHPAVPSPDVLIYSQSADVGISLIEDVCLSYRYCLPNKLFEYILSGIPVITSNFPDMTEIVSKYQCGWVAEPTVVGLRRVITEMTPDDRSVKKRMAAIASTRLDWQLEAQRLIAAYRRLSADSGLAT